MKFYIYIYISIELKIISFLKNCGGVYFIYTLKKLYLLYRKIFLYKRIIFVIFLYSSFKLFFGAEYHITLIFFFLFYRKGLHEWCLGWLLWSNFFPHNFLLLSFFKLISTRSFTVENPALISKCLLLFYLFNWFFFNYTSLGVISLPYGSLYSNYNSFSEADSIILSLDLPT